jgi:hypothetical protein
MSRTVGGCVCQTQDWTQQSQFKTDKCDNAEHQGILAVSGSVVSTVLPRSNEQVIEAQGQVQTRYDMIDIPED